MLGVLSSDERAARKLQSQLGVASKVLAKHEQRQASEARAVSSDLEVIAEARRRVAAWEADTSAEAEAQRARVKLVLSSLSVRGQEFLAAELQLSNLPRLLRKEPFVRRFQDRVLAGADAELKGVVADVAAWVNTRAAAQSRATAELLEARLDLNASSNLGARPRGGASAAAAGCAPSPTALLAAAAWGDGDGFSSPQQYQAQRQRLLLGLQQSAAASIEAYDASAASARLLTTAQSALAQTAFLGAGAVGLSGLVVVKARLTEIDRD